MSGSHAGERPDDPRREQARRLRARARMSPVQLAAHFGVDRDTVAAWLWDAPAGAGPGDARGALRRQAEALRQDGWTVPRIADELGVAKSTAYQWVRHLPLDATREQGADRRRRHSRVMTDARWEPHRRARDAQRTATTDAEAELVGALSDREVLLLGAATYWCEGVKAKPWRPNACSLTFINSDVALISIFLRFVELLGVDRSGLHYRVSIHQSADAEAAGRWWATAIGVSFDAFRRPTLKKHNPRTVRRNVGGDYRGCLIIYVPQSRLLYWRAEGIMRGIALAGSPEGQVKMSPRT